jgi:3-dehydroquinate dehydratase
MEKKNNKIITLQKIPIKNLMEILSELYNEGADYVDISGMPDEDQDVISIFVREEYMNEDDDDEEYDEGRNSDLSDDDLNQLI